MRTRWFHRTKLYSIIRFQIDQISEHGFFEAYRSFRADRADLKREKEREQVLLHVYNLRR